MDSTQIPSRCLCSLLHMNNMCLSRGSSTKKGDIQHSSSRRCCECPSISFAELLATGSDDHRAKLGIFRFSATQLKVLEHDSVGKEHWDLWRWLHTNWKLRWSLHPALGPRDPEYRPSTGHRVTEDCDIVRMRVSLIKALWLFSLRNNVVLMLRNRLKKDMPAISLHGHQLPPLDNLRNRVWCDWLGNQTSQYTSPKLCLTSHNRLEVLREAHEQFTTCISFDQSPAAPHQRDRATTLGRGRVGNYMETCAVLDITSTDHLNPVWYLFRK